MKSENLPTISPRYWTAILVASLCGANTGDFLAHNLHLGHYRGLLPLCVVVLLIFWAEKRAVIRTEAFYWLAVIVVRTAATNLADLATSDFKASFWMVGAFLAILLIALLLFDRRRRPEAPDSIATVRLPKADALYWVTLLVAGILGTAAGDFVSHEIGLVSGSVLLGVLYGAVLFASTRWGGMTSGWYWSSIVAARTAGTDMGDLVAHHWGLAKATILTTILLGAILVFWRERYARPNLAA